MICKRRIVVDQPKVSVRELLSHNAPESWVSTRAVATELTVFSDYSQIHLLASDYSSAELADQWANSALLEYLALADDAIGIRAGVNGDVTVTIDVNTPNVSETDPPHWLKPKRKGHRCETACGRFSSCR